MATAAHSGKVRTGGTSTAFTNEACTRLTANTVYQITDSTKRVLNPAVTPVVQVDASGGGSWVTAAATSYTLNYLFGIVTFTADQGGSALVRFSTGSYLPLLDLAEVTNWKFSASVTELEKTSLDSGGVKQRIAGLRDLDGDLETLAAPELDLDSGAGTTKLGTLVENGTPLLFEREAASKRFRAWVIGFGLDESAGVDGLNKVSFKFKHASQKLGASFGWEP